MITQKGYSKDPSIMPDGIVLTFPKKFLEDRGMTPAQFEKYFREVLQNEDTLWYYKLTNLPLQDVAFVYFILEGMLAYRTNLVQYERNTAHTFVDSIDGKVRDFPPTNWVVVCGPVVECPYDRELKGFQGFRYCTKLF